MAAMPPTESEPPVVIDDLSATLDEVSQAPETRASVPNSDAESQLLLRGA